MRLTASGPRRQTVIHFRYIILMVAVGLGGLLMLTFNTNSISVLSNNDIITPLTKHYQLYIDAGEKFEIQTEGCTIPEFQPFNDLVQSFIYPPNQIKNCSHSESPLLTSNKTHIWTIKENLLQFNITDISSISCCYKSFYRPSFIPNIFAPDIDDRVIYDECSYFTDFVEVMNEFVKVSCYHNEKNIYEQFFLFAINNPATDEKYSTANSKNSSEYNVIVLGIDAVSRLNFHRTMPKTLKFLKEKGSIELLGYNKVGDNTFPNLAPMLMGLDERELKHTCWPTSKNSFDNCPFIWDWFKEAGYQTALGEDTALLGTFNLQKPGFIGTPTDYYLRTFIHQAEICTGHNKDYNSFLCMGNKYSYQILLDYVEDLATTLTSSGLFGFFWETSMSHDYLNYPMVMDDSYEYLLRRLETSNYLNETILIMISDHGIRWGEIRLTRQGYFEERLPLAHVLLPPSFQEKYSMAYKNLKSNIHHLTTPFDIHKTLYDLVDLEDINNERISSRMKEFYASNRGISLFLPVPTNRTCRGAGIDDHWCACHRGHKVDVKLDEVQQAAIQLVKHLNTKLDQFPQCAELNLAQIEQATEMATSKHDGNEENLREFLIVVRTTPGDGMFEGTLKHSQSEWSMAGPISRLNLYGEHGRCIQNPQLRLYCFCR